MTDNVMSDPYIQKLKALKPKFKDMNLKRVRVFGSRLRGDARPDSDLDILVDFIEEPSLFDLGGLYMDMKDLIGCEVSISQPELLRKEFKDIILSEATDV